MAFNNEYPYTDFHELNLDWVMAEVKKLHNEVEEKLPVSDGSITTRKIADDAVTTRKIADGAVTNDKLAPEVAKKLNNSYVTPQMFGAVADGVTNDFSAFQAAILASDNVLIPSGNYFVSGTLELTGSKSICGFGGKPHITTDTTLFNLSSLYNNIENIAIYSSSNDAHTLTSVVETPAFITGVMAYSKIKNVSIGNAYVGIDVIIGGASLIDGIDGYPLKYGIKIQDSVDITRINNINFNPNYYGTPSLIYQDYVYKNGYALFIGRADWGYVNNAFCYGYNGLVYTSSGEAISGSANNFVFNNFGCDSCAKIFKFEHNSGGFKFSNGYVTLFNANYDAMLAEGLNPIHADYWPLSINLNNTSEYENNDVTIENVLFNRADYNILHIEGASEVIFKNCKIKNMQQLLERSNVAPVVFCEGNGHCVIDGNTFIGNWNGDKQGIRTLPTVINKIIVNNYITGVSQASAFDGANIIVANNNGFSL